MSKWERISTTALMSVAIWGVLFAVVLLTTGFTGEQAGPMELVVPIGLASVYFLTQSWRIQREAQDDVLRSPQGIGHPER
jgi:hypothetical protein